MLNIGPMVQAPEFSKNSLRIPEVPARTPDKCDSHRAERTLAKPKASELRSLRRAHSAPRPRFKIRSRAKESAMCAAANARLRHLAVRALASCFPELSRVVPSPPAGLSQSPRAALRGQNLRSVCWSTLLNCLPLLSRVARQQNSAVQTNRHALITNERDIGDVAERYLFYLLPLAARVLTEHPAASSSRPQLLVGRILRDGVSGCG